MSKVPFPRSTLLKLFVTPFEPSTGNTENGIKVPKKTTQGYDTKIGTSRAVGSTVDNVAVHEARIDATQISSGTVTEYPPNAASELTSQTPTMPSSNTLTTSQFSIPLAAISVPSSKASASATQPTSHLSYVPANKSRSRAQTVSTNTKETNALSSNSVSFAALVPLTTENQDLSKTNSLSRLSSPIMANFKIFLRSLGSSVGSRTNIVMQSIDDSTTFPVSVYHTYTASDIMTDNSAMTLKSNLPALLAFTKPEIKTESLLENYIYTMNSTENGSSGAQAVTSTESASSSIVLMTRSTVSATPLSAETAINSSLDPATPTKSINDIITSTADVDHSESTRGELSTARTEFPSVLSSMLTHLSGSSRSSSLISPQGSTISSINTNKMAETDSSSGVPITASSAFRTTETNGLGTLSTQEHPSLTPSSQQIPSLETEIQRVTSLQTFPTLSSPASVDSSSITTVEPTESLGFLTVSQGDGTVSDHTISNTSFPTSVSRPRAASLSFESTTVSKNPHATSFTQHPTETPLMLVSTETETVTTEISLHTDGSSSLLPSISTTTAVEISDHFSSQNPVLRSITFEATADSLSSVSVDFGSNIKNITAYNSQETTKMIDHLASSTSVSMSDDTSPSIATKMATSEANTVVYSKVSSSGSSSSAATDKTTTTNELASLTSAYLIWKSTVPGNTEYSSFKSQKTEKATSSSELTSQMESSMSTPTTERYIDSTNASSTSATTAFPSSADITLSISTTFEEATTQSEDSTEVSTQSMETSVSNTLSSASISQRELISAVSSTNSSMTEFTEAMSIASMSPFTKSPILTQSSSSQSKPVSSVPSFTLSTEPATLNSGSLPSAFTSTAISLPSSDSVTSRGNEKTTVSEQTVSDYSSASNNISLTTVLLESLPVSLEHSTISSAQYSSSSRTFLNTELNTLTSVITEVSERTTNLLSSSATSTEVPSLLTYTTEPPLSRPITSPHSSQTSLTPAVVPTANFTHSSVTEEITADNLSSAPLSTFFSTERGGELPLESTSVPPAASTAPIAISNATLHVVETTSTQVAPTSLTRTTQETVISGTPTHTPMSTVASSTGAVSTTQPITSSTPLSTPQPSVTSRGTSVTAEIMKTSSSPSITITSPLTSKVTITSQTSTFTTSGPNRPGPATTPTGMPTLQCNTTERIWVKTVLSLNIRRYKVDGMLKQNLTKGLTQALQEAFNSSGVHAQIENLTSSTNVTVGYYAASGSTVYIASVVVSALNAYGIDRMMTDIKQYVAEVQSIPIPAAPWIPSPAISLQLKTVLRFVGPTDNINSCSFVQTMEQRLQNAFAEAESKVLNSHSHLSVQILSTTQSAGSPAVSLIYVVRNQSVVLNGTISSNLLNQLTAELVGYYLFFPPLIIAEPLEYHNLNTSQSTRDYWVITVIQDVDNSSLEGNYQSFASLMEQRLAELFVIAGQQGRRFRRATTVGSYTVQMVNIKRIPGPKNPAELIYYVLWNGSPLLGTSAAKILNTVDSQTMALTLGYFVQLQAEPVVKNPPNNLWIIAAVLAPIAVVTIIIIIITAVLCRKNKNDFKADTMGNMHPRAKPVQGFDYAKQHLGQQGGEEEALPVTQETVVLPLPVRDAPLSQERGISHDGSTTKKTLSSDMRKSRLPSEDGSLISNESGKLNSSRGSVLKVTAQQKMTKEEAKKRNGVKFKNRIDPFDTSSGSLQLISIKPLAAPPSYSHPASDRSQDSAVINGEVSMALKQKSDIEHYRNKLRLKAKRKGYYDFPVIEGNSKPLTHRQKQEYEKAQIELNKVLNPDEEIASTYVKSRNRQSQMKNPYRSRQSLNSPSPGGTEMDLLVTRERPRRGIRNSGYDTEPELIEETNVDRIAGPRSYTRGRQVKGHSETSTLSSQPSIDEVRQQMHLLLEEAFSLVSAGHVTNSRHQGHYNPGQQIPYSDVVTSAPGTMNRPSGVQWVPAYGSDMYQYSLPRPAFRFTQLPDMAVGSPPPPVPPRTGPTAVTSLRRSSSDIESKTRTSESSIPEQQSQHDTAPYVPITRAPISSASVEQPISNFSGNPAPAVYAIPANRPGYTGYFIPTPSAPYRTQAWMPYPSEGDVPNQWAESVPLPGYVEAYPHSRYHQNSPPRHPRHYSQASPVHASLEQPPTPSTAASQQSLTENDTSDTSLTNISTAALVKAIREEVAKLAKKQTDMFEFQV
ncbi:UPF0606 protein KIAA1549L isoform X2 [Lepisosteus oculatus]|uniref:UPF0606 protein KIAA1549L isoform X2 n=1 Tax=Lepisosteus oculatus TaxID=7918 RepID=UPI0035F50611